MLKTFYKNLILSLETEAVYRFVMFSFIVLGFGLNMKHDGKAKIFSDASRLCPKTMKSDRTRIRFVHHHHKI